MKTTYYLVVWAAAVCVLIGSAHVNAAFVSVESASDGNGVFTYSVTKYSESYTLGGSDELFSFTLKAYQVIELFSPAGWTCTNTGNETYTWLCTNTEVSVIGTNALVFSLQSENELSYTFDQPEYISLYPQGTIAGEIYMEGTIPYHYPTEDNIAAVNVAGMERFSYTGPILPEPTAALLLPCILLALSVRKQTPTGLPRG